MSEQLVRKLLFTDCTCLIAYTERALQCITSCLAEATELFGLEMRLNKTKVPHHSVTWDSYHPTTISIGQTEMKKVQMFINLGSVISSDLKIVKEMDNKFLNTFGWHYKHISKCNCDVLVRTESHTEIWISCWDHATACYTIPPLFYVQQKKERKESTPRGKQKVKIKGCKFGLVLDVSSVTTHASWDITPIQS